MLSFIQWERLPLEKGGMPMQYVTYEDLIQIGLFIVALIGLVYEICHHNDKKLTAPSLRNLDGLFMFIYSLARGTT